MRCGDEEFNAFLAETRFRFKFQTLEVVLLRLDYGNGVLIGLPTYLVRRLQSVVNASKLHG